MGVSLINAHFLVESLLFPEKWDAASDLGAGENSVESLFTDNYKLFCFGEIGDVTQLVTTSVVISGSTSFVRPSSDEIVVYHQI